jgi:outer membrane protein assembly factor BamB
MATLEIHDAQGRVQFVELARDHPVLFGTSTACDIILEGVGIKPVHGRIRWKSRRYKVEASPDAEYLLINGRKMTSGSMRQGDEVAVGACRIFMLRSDDDLATTARKTAPPRDERTRVLPPPSVPQDQTGHRGHRWPSRSRRESLLERDDWFASLKRSEPRPKVIEAAQIPLARAADKEHRHEHRRAEPEVKSPPAWRVWLERLWALRRPAAPGRERIISSPLVIALVASLAILVGMGFWLKEIIAATIATRTFDRGVQNYDDGDYRTAMRDFDAFLSAYPRDGRAGKARVLRALANVRQYVSPEGGTWSSALAAAKEMEDQVGGLEEFRDVRADLAELIIRVGEGLADRARQSADQQSLDDAESSVPLHARAAGEPAPAFLNRSRLPSKLVAARAAVHKAQVRSKALWAMDQALKDGSASRVYDARDNLVNAYADLARDRDLVTRMTAANELIRRAVAVDPARRPAERTPRPDPLGPPTTLVLRSGSGAPAGDVPAEKVVYALADGFGFALDGTTGAPLWHVPLGLASPFVPQAIPGDGTVIAFDARFNDLLRLDARTSALKWRLALAEPVSDPPLVLGNQLALVLPSGKLLLIGLESGELETTVNLGRPLARTPAHDESGQHLYILGRQDCLFVLTRDPLACAAAVYLGHADGSIACAPARLGRFLVVAENESLYESRLHVLVLGEDGVKVTPTQALDVAGWIWQTPANSGPILWGTGDKGGYEAFSVGDYDSNAPFRSVARLAPDAGSSGPSFALARSERELWVASGHSGRFDLDPERGSIEPKSPMAQPGPALAPIQTAGSIIILTFQDQQSGGVALWGIDPETGSAVWKTIVAAAWPTPLAPAAGSNGLALFSRGGRQELISQDQLARGGFVVQQVPRPGDFALPAGSRLPLEAGGKPLVAIVPAHRGNSMWVQDPAKAGAWLKIDLPAALAAEPVAWGGGVLIPGLDSRAYLIDPLTARSRAEPFVPKFDRDRQGKWRAPAVVDGQTVVLADDGGRVHRVTLKATPVAHLVGEAQATLGQHIVADPVSTSGAVIVVTADRRVRALAVRDLSPVGTWTLDAPLAGPPAGIGDGCFIMDRSGGVMAFGSGGNRLWSIELAAEVTGPPLIQEDAVWMITRDGQIHVRARSDGSARDRFALGILPESSLLMAGSQTLVAAGGGTVRPVAAQPKGANKR